MDLTILVASIDLIRGAMECELGMDCTIAVAMDCEMGMDLIRGAMDSCYINYAD